MAKFAGDVAFHLQHARQGLSVGCPVPAVVQEECGLVSAAAGCGGREVDCAVEDPWGVC